MEYAKKKAWDLSQSLEINDFPFDSLWLNDHNLGFIIASYSNSKEYIKVKRLEKYTKQYNGFAVKDDDGIVILYSDNLDYEKRNKVVMHEVGHIIMGHTSFNNILGNSADKAVENCQEQEANLFAISFLAPAPKLIHIGVIDSINISRVTGLSMNDSDLIAAEIQREMKIAKEVKYGRQKKIMLSICCWTLFYLVLLFVLISFYNYSVGSQQTPINRNTMVKSNELSSTFYITKTGEKYHLGTCHYVKDKGIEISVLDAKKEGYTPCKVCNPLE